MTISATSAAPPLREVQMVLARKQRTLWGDVWVQFRRNKLAILGMTMLAMVLIFVLVGPLIYTVDPKRVNIVESDAVPGAQHPLGTDDLGRDLLARNLYGGRISLAVGVIAMLLSMLLGATIGLLSGYIAWTDNLLMRFTDMMFALPSIPLLLVISSLFQEPLRLALGQELGAFILVVTVIGVLSWMPTARIVRGSVLSVKQKEFVEAAINVGVRKRVIMFRHILPNVFSAIIVSATLGIATAILTESTLSFLGFGFPSDTPTWGRLLYDGKDFLVSGANIWISLWPGLLISLTILSINFMGDGLRDALDPRQRQ